METKVSAYRRKRTLQNSLMPTKASMRWLPPCRLCRRVGLHPEMRLCGRWRISAAVLEQSLLLCGGENRKPEHPMEGIRRSSLGSSGELEPLRTGNQPSFLLGLWHAPDTLIAVSNSRGNPGLWCGESTKCCLGENFTAERNDQNNILHRVQRQP